MKHKLEFQDFINVVKNYFFKFRFILFAPSMNDKMNLFWFLILEKP